MAMIIAPDGSPRPYHKHSLSRKLEAIQVVSEKIPRFIERTRLHLDFPIDSAGCCHIVLGNNYKNLSGRRLLRQVFGYRFHHFCYAIDWASAQSILQDDPVERTIGFLEKWLVT